MLKYPQFKAKFFFATISISVLFLQLSIPGHAQVVNEVLKRIEANYRKTSTFQADIRFERYDPQIDEWDISNGKLISTLKSKDPTQNYLRIDWKQPKEDIFLVARGKFTVYMPSLKMAYTGTASAGATETKFLPFMHFSRSEMIKAYLFNLIGEEKLRDGTKTYRLSLASKVKGKY